MISVRKFWTIVFITIALSFSLLAYADTYWLNGNKVKDTFSIRIQGMMVSHRQFQDQRLSQRWEYTRKLMVGGYEMHMIVGMTSI